MTAAAPPSGAGPAERRRFPLLPALGLFAAGFAILSWPWLSGRVTVPWDAKAQFYPQLQFLAASLARGEAPFWTPNVFAGWPQIADPQSLIFSPLHFLLAALNAEPGFRAADAVTFAYLLLGGVALILFFRDRGWRMGGALVAALMFAFGGSAASRLQHTGQVMSVAYLAMALWPLDRTLRSGSVLWAQAAGVVVAFLAIERDQVAMLGLYVVAGFVIADWCAAPQPFGRVRETLPTLTVAGVVAIALSAVPLLFTALLAADSNRPEIAYAEATRGSLPPADLLTLAIANLFGASMPDVTFWGPESFPWKAAFGDNRLVLAQNMGELYAGAVAPVALFGIGVARGKLWAGEIRYFAIALVLVLLYALGWYTPVYRVFYAVMPGAEYFRRPADATFVLGLLLAIVCGYCVHCWIDDRAAPSTTRQRVAGIAMASILLLLPVMLAVKVGALATAALPIGIAIVAVGATLVALSLARRLEGASASAAAAVLVIVLTADLAWNNAPNISTGLPPAMYEAMLPSSRNATVALIQKRLAETAAPDRRDRIELIGIAYHWPNLSLSHGFDHILGQNPLRLHDFTRATCDCDTVAVPEQRTFSPLFPSYRSVFANLFGLRLIATGVPVEQIDRKLAPGDLSLLARTADAFVYENNAALPRVMMVPAAREADFDRLLREGWPEGVDPRRVVLLAHAPPGSAGNAGGASGGTARIIRYANTEVVVATESEAQAFLVLNDAWHPWWSVEVDGVPQNLLRANVLFRAVALPPGKHRVRFAFRPLYGAWRELLRRIGASS